MLKTSNLCAWGVLVTTVAVPNSGLAARLQWCAHSPVKHGAAALSILQDRHEVIQRAEQAGAAAIVLTGCTVKSAKAARHFCEAITDYPLAFTAGVHPHNAKNCSDTTLNESWQLADHEQ